MKYRLFLAIPLPENLKQAIGAYRATIQLSDARWVAEDNLHITISFFGNIDEERIPKIIEQIHMIAEKSKHFTLAFAQAEFAPRKRPRMLWLRYHEHDAFYALVTAVETTIGKTAAIEFERKKTVPHVTLARLKAQPIPDQMTLKQPMLNPLPVTSVNLYSSVLTPQGPTYNILHEFTL